MTDKTTEAFDAWWADEGEQSLYALNTTTDDDIKILAGIAWEAAIRDVLAECKPAPDGRIPKTVFTIEDIGKAAEMGRQAGMIDALAEQALQKLSDFHQYMEATEPVKQEPVGVISESAIGLVKLHSNGVSLPFDTPLYAAPVRTKDLTDDEAQKLWNDTSSIVPMWAHHLHFARAVIAADREKNK